MTDTAHLARRLLDGLNGDPDQRAANALLSEAAHGIWLSKLTGHDQYLVQASDRPGSALWIDWRTLREDLNADDTATRHFHAWTQTWEGRHATDDQHDAKWTALVPVRPWHGASTSEKAILRIAADLAPGGTWAEGIARFDPHNRAAVLAAVAELVEGQHLPPGATGPQPTTRRAAELTRGWGNADPASHRSRGR